MDDLEFYKLYHADILKSIEQKVEQKVKEEMYKNSKCNQCVWGYKEAHYCPLGRCIQGNK